AAVECPTGRHTPLTVADSPVVLHGRPEARVNDHQAHGISLPSVQEAPDRDPVAAEDSPDEIRIRHRLWLIAMNAESCHPSLLDQPDDLKLDLARVVQDRTGLGAGNKRVWGAIAAVGKALGDVRNALFPGQSLQERARLAQQGQIEAPGRQENASCDRLPRLGLVVKRAVGLEKTNRQTHFARPCPERFHLLQDQTLDLSGRDHLLAPAEPLPIGEAGMGANDDGTISRRPQRLANRCGIAGMGTAADACGRYTLQEIPVALTTLAKVRVQVDGSPWRVSPRLQVAHHAWPRIPWARLAGTGSGRRPGSGRTPVQHRRSATGCGPAGATHRAIRGDRFRSGAPRSPPSRPAP